MSHDTVKVVIIVKTRRENTNSLWGRFLPPSVIRSNRSEFTFRTVQGCIKKIF